MNLIALESRNLGPEITTPLILKSPFSCIGIVVHEVMLDTDIQQFRRIKQETDHDVV